PRARETVPRAGPRSSSPWRERRMLADRNAAIINDGTAGAGAPPPGLSAKPAPARRRLLLGLTLSGVASLAYVLGAAVMFFQLPGSAFLHRAFVGARAWYDDRREAESQVPGEPWRRAIAVTADKPGQ